MARSDATRAGVAPSWALHPLVVGVWLSLVVAAVYGPFVTSPFVFDDYHSVVDNPAIRSVANIPEFFTTGKGFSVRATWHAYRPLLLSSFALSYALTGPEAWSFRLVSCFLHAANGLLVFLLLRRLLGAAVGAAPALAGALLFALHPAQTQAVMYVCSRSEVLSAFFILAALLFFLRGVDEAGSAGRRWLGGWMPAAVAFVLAMCSKEAAVLLLPGAILVAAVRVPECSARHVRRIAALVAPFAVLYVLHTRMARALTKAAALAGRALETLDPSTGGAGTGAQAANGGTEVLRHLAAFNVYPRLTLWPYPLSIFHQPPEEGAALVLGAAVSVVLLAALGVGAVWALRNGRRFAALGFVWFPAMLVPYFFATLNMKVNEHRLYLALFGLSLLVTDWLRHAAGRRRGSVVALTALLALCALGTVIRNRQWMDPERFWRNEIAAAPDTAWPYENLAQYYDRQGRDAEALETFRAATARKRADLGLAHNYFGMHLIKQGRIEDASRHFKDAVAYAPASPDYHCNLGVALDDLGRRAEAEQHFLRALALTPCFAKAYFNLAVTYARTDRIPEAETALRRALACDDYYAKAHAELGKLLFERGDTGEALPHLERAAALGAADADVSSYLTRARAPNAAAGAAGAER